MARRAGRAFATTVAIRGAGVSGQTFRREGAGCLGGGLTARQFAVGLGSAQIAGQRPGAARTVDWVARGVRRGADHDRRGRRRRVEVAGYARSEGPAAVIRNGARDHAIGKAVRIAQVPRDALGVRNACSTPRRFAPMVDVTGLPSEPHRGADIACVRGRRRHLGHPGVREDGNRRMRIAAVVERRAALLAGDFHKTKGCGSFRRQKSSRNHAVFLEREGTNKASMGCRIS